MARNPSAAKAHTSLGWSWRVGLLLVLVLLSAGAGGAMGYFMRFDLPDVRTLEDYRPPVMTRILDSNGEVLETFSEQKRILIDFNGISDLFQQALLATEDTDFYRHTGIDFKGILRAVLRDLRSRRLAQGASTLTQQLARNLFLHPDKTIKRKLQEAMLAVQIEREYTKQEILRFYCNQVYMGHGRYGLEAASRYYYDKPAREMTLTEAATLAGLIQRPTALSPRTNPERSLQRRNHVLRRMVDVGYLETEIYEQAAQQPIDLLEDSGNEAKIAPYFVEEIRRWLQDKYGSDSLYNAGLQVTTTLDPQLQILANQAVEAGLRSVDKRQGWRGAPEKLPADADPESWESPDWSDGITAGRVVEALVLAVERSKAQLRVGPHRTTLDREQTEWTQESDLRKLFAPRDRIQIRIEEIGEDGALRASLEQEPQVEGALVAIEPASGAIRALVGGFDFERSEFNRAIQAKRQTGSAFKPFVYAAALSEGWTLSDRLLDQPTVFLDPAKPEPYQPENYTNKYYGQVTLRSSLERSANITTVKLLDAVGYRPVIDMAKRVGFGKNMRAFPSLALGAFETSLLQLTSAYSSFANHGIRVEPHMVEEVRDRDAVVVESIEPQVHDALSRQLAYLMNQALRGVILRGTGRGVASLPYNIAGKTGTTDDYTDAWFVGYAPNLAVGVWVGFDEPHSLGEKETGARAALPIWRAFVEQALARLPVEDFERPPGIHTVKIDRRTGLRASRSAYCTQVSDEVFVEGTEPSHSCSVYEHQLANMPYMVQRYPLNESGELQVPARELEALVSGEPTLRLADGGRRLEFFGPDQTVTLPIRSEYSLETPNEVEPEVDPRLAEFEWEEWVGQDERPATIVWFRGRSRLRASK